MEVMVKLKDDAHTAPVTDALADMGLSLRSVHPRTEDPTLRSYSTVEVPDEATARQVTERLTGLEQIEAAYVQPPAELP